MTRTMGLREKRSWRSYLRNKERRRIAREKTIDRRMFYGWKRREARISSEQENLHAEQGVRKPESAGTQTPVRG